MGRKCAVCTHPQRDVIDEAIVTKTSTKPALSALYGMTTRSIIRHANAHLIPKVTKAMQTREQEHDEYEQRISTVVAHEMARASNIFERAVWLYRVAEEELLGAKKDGERRYVLQSIDRAERCLELVAKMSGTLMAQERARYPTTAEIVSALSMQQMAELLPLLEARERGEMVDSTAIERLIGGERGDTEGRAR